MDATLLQNAAETWKKLCNTTYVITYGFKAQLNNINLTFNPADFPHMAGFQYLKDISMPKYSPSRYMEMILKGTITQEIIEKGQQYEAMVKPRLIAIVSLEAMFDNTFFLYSFRPEFLHFYTSIKANFLLTSEINNTSFVFLIQSGQHENTESFDCTCLSSFIKGNRDIKNHHNC